MIYSKFIVQKGPSWSIKKRMSKSNKILCVCVCAISSSSDTFRGMLRNKSFLSAPHGLQLHLLTLLTSEISGYTWQSCSSDRSWLSTSRDCFSKRWYGSRGSGSTRRYTLYKERADDAARQVAMMPACESRRVAAATATASSRRPMWRHRDVVPLPWIPAHWMDARNSHDTDHHLFLSFHSSSLYRAPVTKNMYQGPYSCLHFAWSKCKTLLVQFRTFWLIRIRYTKL